MFYNHEKEKKGVKRKANCHKEREGECIISNKREQVIICIERESRIFFLVKCVVRKEKGDLNPNPCTHIFSNFDVKARFFVTTIEVWVVF